MKGNGGKCHVLLSTKEKEKVVTNVDSAQIQNSHCEKLLGVIIDNKLNFKEHLKTLCGKSKSKLSLGFSRVSDFYET